MTYTIIEAIKTVLAARGTPMTVAEIFNEITKEQLYVFKADDPKQIVRNQIRRHCQGLDFVSASQKKYFVLTPDGRYDLLCTNQQNPAVLSQASKQKPVSTSSPRSSDKDYLGDLKRLHGQYIAEFRNKVLEQLRLLEPASFERFCRNLLDAYGFRDMKVTQVSKDGGIDGYGKLKVGFTYFKVAFQCKRWVKKSIGRPEIDKFRGAIQGQYEQGIFFTTATFSQDAERNSLKSGAVPIILINGETIVDVMIENNFGIDLEHLPIYSLALDLAIGDE